MEVISMYVEAARGAALTSQQMTQTATPIQPTADTAESSTNHVESAAVNKSTDGDSSFASQFESADAQSVAQQQANENERLKKAIEKLTEQLPNSEAKFGIHEATNRIMITIVDKDTQEVIKEIPPEKNLDMLAKSLEMAGVLVDHKL